MIFHKAKPDAIINISYSQIAVFEHGLEKPFNNWTRDQVAQGFSWRKESVSFKTLSESGDVNVFVRIKDKMDIYDNSTRAIVVPFNIKGEDGIEISSIADSIEIKIGKGKYNLLFQTGMFLKNNEWCEFSFIKAKEYVTDILKADNEITKRNNFIMKADPA
jgi:hypothetical protein